MKRFIESKKQTLGESAMGKNILKVYIDPKSNEDKVTEVIDELTKIHSTVTRGDDDGNEYIIIERNSHMEMSNTTNPIKGEFDDSCDPVIAAKQLAEIVDNIL